MTRTELKENLRNMKGIMTELYYLLYDEILHLFGKELVYEEDQ